MSGFSLLRPSSLDEAAGQLDGGSRPLAGGSDLVPLLRDGLVRAEALVDVRALLPRGIERIASPGPTADGPTERRVGGGTTLAELERSEAVPAALREACRLAASPQLRNMSTIAGNLRQATRCWYWRLAFPCYLHGGDRCHARHGEHREHAIFGNDECASAHPSDPAAALLALGASIETQLRNFPLADLYRLPTDDDRELTTLEPNELILYLHVPRPDASVYLKAMDRRAWSFPLVGVAAARFGTEVRLALAGVAPIPWALASAASLEGASPLRDNAYKVEIARALVARAHEAVAPKSPAAP